MDVIMQKTRFLIVLSLVCVALFGALHNPAPLQASCAAPTNPIEAENCLTGSSGWLMNLNTMNPADDVNGQIKGYASATSVNKGGSINLHVSVNPAQNYSIEIYRLGWYGGTGGRLIQTITGKSGSKQPDCPANATTGMVACSWAVAHTLNVPTTWVTGVYVAMLVRADGYRSQIVFTVRDDSRTANFIFQYPVTTNAAYNNYPSGTNRSRSLYNFNSCDVVACAEIPALSGTGSKRAVKVSFDRPGGVELSSYRLGYEYYLLQWLEKENYDVQYVTDVDVHGNAALLLNRKGAISAGHDEYWTKEMRDAWEAARSAGTNLAFVGANIAYWQIRLEASAAGAANRVVVGYKDIGNIETNPISNRNATDPYTVGEVPYTNHIDPLALTDPTRNTTTFRNLATPRPEQTLIGVQYNGFVANDPAWFQTYVVQNASSWVYNGAGFSNGSAVPNLVGYEVDKLFSASVYPHPISTTYTTLAQSPFVNTNTANGTLANSVPNDVQQASIYRAPSNAWVFAAGTLNWPYGLARAGYTNTGIQQTMRNVMNQFLLPAGTGTSTPTPTPTRTPTATNTAIAGATNTPTATSTPTATPAGSVCVNKLANAGFEGISQLTGSAWEDWGNTAMNPTGHTGQAIQVGPAAGGFSQGIAVSPGQNYSLKFWGKASATLPGTGVVVLSFFTDSSHTTAVGANISTDINPSAAYVEYIQNVTVPAGATWLTTWVWQNASASDLLMLDDFCLSLQGASPNTATPTPTATATLVVNPIATPTPAPANTATPTPTATPTSSLPSITIFVNAAPYSIQNFVFNSNISGSTAFSLDNSVPDDNDGVPISRTMTVNPGNYNITQQIPATWQLGQITCNVTGAASTSNNLTLATAYVTVQNGSTATCIFVNWRDSNIFTSIFRDDNANGVMDSGESSLKNWTVRLYEMTSPTTRVLKDTRTSNNSGQANFNNWPSNRTYQVCQVMQSNWTNTLPSSVINNEACYTVTLAPGTSVDRAFGNRQTVLNKLSPFNTDWMQGSGFAQTEIDGATLTDDVSGQLPSTRFLAYGRLPVPFHMAGYNGHYYADKPDQFEKLIYLPVVRSTANIRRK